MKCLDTRRTAKLKDPDPHKAAARVWSSGSSSGAFARERREGGF